MKPLHTHSSLVCESAVGAKAAGSSSVVVADLSAASISISISILISIPVSISSASGVAVTIIIIVLVAVVILVIVVVIVLIDVLLMVVVIVAVPSTVPAIVVVSASFLGRCAVCIYWLLSVLGVEQPGVHILLIGGPENRGVKGGDGVFVDEVPELLVPIP